MRAAPGLNFEVVRWFEDAGISGLRADRPGFQTAIAYAREHRVAAVLVHKFDRFSRDPEHQAVFKAALKRDGIRVVSVAEPTDDSPAGFLTEKIMDAFAAYYSLNLSTEVKKGYQQRRKAGKHIGAAPLGYRWENGQLVVVPEEAQVVETIYGLAEQGMGGATICRRLNDLGLLTKPGNLWMDHTAISRVLRCPTYAALVNDQSRSYRKTVQGRRHELPRREWRLCPTDAWPPIIERARWEEMQSLLDRRLRPVRPQSAYLLSGILRCPKCGRHLTGWGTRKGQGRIYGCARNGITHRAVIITAEAIESQVIRALQGLAQGSILPAVAPPERTVNQRDLLKRELAQIEAALERHAEAYRAGVDSLEEYRENKRRELARRAELEALLQAPDPRPQPPSRKTIRQLVAGLRHSTRPISQRRESLGRLIHSIRLPDNQPGSLEIVLRDAHDAR